MLELGDLRSRERQQLQQLDRRLHVQLPSGVHVHRLRADRGLRRHRRVRLRDAVRRGRNVYEHRWQLLVHVRLRLVELRRRSRLRGHARHGDELQQLRQRMLGDHRGVLSDGAKLHVPRQLLVTR